MLRMFYLLTLIATLILTCATSEAQSRAGSTSPTMPTNASPEVSQDLSAGFGQRNPRYTLRPGDSFDIAFAFSPEFNQTATVEPDGFVTFRGARSLHVAGQTLPQLTDSIKEAYSGILQDPAITVSLKDFEKPYFIAAGQVAKPGKYDLRSDLTLVEAVNIAGGFTDASKHSQVLLFRRIAGDKVEARVFDVKKMIASHNLQEDPHLLPGDMLLVPQNAISKIRRYLPTSSMGLYATPLP